MTRDELKKRIMGAVATVPTPFDDDFELDLPRLTDLTRWWVDQGLGTNVAPIKVTAAGGEGPDLEDDEWPHVLRTVVNAAGADKVILCGLKPKDTLHTIEDAKKAQDLGAIGLQIDLPFFHHPNQDDYVRYFTDISDAIDIGIIIYNTFWFGCQSLTADTMLRLANAEHVVAVKWTVPRAVYGVDEGPYYDDMRKFAHIFNVLDMSYQWVRCHKNGGRGYIHGRMAAYPKFDLELWPLLEAQRYDEAQARFDHMRNAVGPWLAKTESRSGGYRQTKGMMAAMGRPAGPPRPPTLPVDEQEIAEIQGILRELGWLAK